MCVSHLWAAGGAVPLSWWLLLLLELLEAQQGLCVEERVLLLDLLGHRRQLLWVQLGVQGAQLGQEHERKDLEVRDQHRLQPQQTKQVRMETHNWKKAMNGCLG